MPTYNGHKIENVSPKRAARLGYLTAAELTTCLEWVAVNKEERINNTLVYIDGEYKCTAKRNTPIYKIVEKFKL